MENITTTIDATAVSRVRSVCPQVGRVVLAGNAGWVKGATVSFAAPSLSAAMGPQSIVGGFDATTDLSFRPFGVPPV